MLRRIRKLRPTFEMSLITRITMIINAPTFDKTINVTKYLKLVNDDYNKHYFHMMTIKVIVKMFSKVLTHERPMFPII